MLVVLREGKIVLIRHDDDDEVDNWQNFECQFKFKNKSWLTQRQTLHAESSIVFYAKMVKIERE